MQWNEVGKKTIGIIITLGVVFGGTVLVVAGKFVHDRGGERIAGIVTEAVKSQRITVNGDGRHVVADRLVVTFRENVSASARQAAAEKAGVRINGAVTEEPGAFIVSFPSMNGLQLRYLIERIKQSADIASVAVIPVE